MTCLDLETLGNKNWFIVIKNINSKIYRVGFNRICKIYKCYCVLQAAADSITFEMQ